MPKLPSKQNLKLVSLVFIAAALTVAVWKYSDVLAYHFRVLGLRIDCNDIRPRHYIGQRGDCWVLYNYILANRKFRCWESITYTTHADFTFLGNLEPLLSRWKGPISLALYTPGTDFSAALRAISYLRECVSEPVADLVTFHFYFPSKHMPKTIPKTSSLWETKYNCAMGPPWTDSSATYRAQKKLVYPINVGRNVAREMATTHFILASDIELYPSPGVIEDFLEMMWRQDAPLQRPGPKVFPLPVFELAPNATVPKNKVELVSMLTNGTAIVFHQELCNECHRIPYYDEWLKATWHDGDLRVFGIAKRTWAYSFWEPIFIGTQAEPLYDERLSWEGKAEKMPQGYALCVLDYEFHILDNAFLVHKPGIKPSVEPSRYDPIVDTFSFIKKTVRPELNVLYGAREGCIVY